MTTKAAAALYEAEHIAKYNGYPIAIYNPHNKEVRELPVIYGFNNGGSPGFMYAALVAQDGTGLGGHLCSSEAYMPADLGVLDGTRPDRHETFRQHYPNGYRMEFVSRIDVKHHKGLMEAINLNKERQDKA